LTQSTPSHPISLRYILILSTHLRLGLPSGLLPYGFPTNILYAFLFSPHVCYMPCPSHRWLICYKGICGHPSQPDGWWRVVSLVNKFVYIRVVAIK
jgi:hypothetical protein